MTKPRISPSVAAYGGNIYVFGGMASTSRGYYDPIFDGDTFEMYDTAECFDIETRKWSEISRLPEGDLCGGKTFVYEGRIYIVGGKAFTQVPPPAQAKAPTHHGFLPLRPQKRVLPVWRRIWAYDPTSDTYEHITDIPEGSRALIGYGTVVVGSMLYLIGGSNHGPCIGVGLYNALNCKCDIQKTVLGFHLPTKTWVMDLPELNYARKAPACFYDGHTIQVVGGHNELEYKSVVQFLAIDEFEAPAKFRWASEEKLPMGASFQAVQCQVPYFLMCKMVQWMKG